MFERLITQYEGLPADMFAGDPADEMYPKDYNCDAINDVCGTLCEIFINDHGCVDFNAIIGFNAEYNGRYKIVRGESDSFGWVSGVFKDITNNRMIVFG
jgi:hypothetical protein